MANKTLKYFMREEAKQEAIVKVPGPDTIRDENGKIVDFEIKVLSNEKIVKINEMYKSRTPARDKKGNYIIQNGELIFRSEKDNAKAARHIMVEALVYPDLKDPELMQFYKCNDITEMPFKVFPTGTEYAYVSKKVMEVLGMIDPAETKDEKDLEDAKN